ncbi:g10551 [Coccomyxa viridis]|uniref:G10551 protein n=1 Tax=Coccomyxa viridis TaxID=1274662 RepID=A0ABP1GAH1_9CHLO
MSNSFALLGGDDGFQQVPSKKSRKKKNRSQDQNPAAEASVTPSSAPSEVSEETAGAPSDAFQQVKGTAKFKRQHKVDADTIGQEEQAASRAKTQDTLQELFKRWNSSMEQVGAGAAHTSGRSESSFREALAQSTAIDTALGHILGLPEPWAMEQSLASFLGVLMHEEGSRPEKLASAIVGIAGAAGKDGGKEFDRDARHALHTVGLTLRHMVTQSAASEASQHRSEEEAQLAQQCSAKEAALRNAHSTEERLHLARDVHSLCARRLEVSGPSAPSILKPMQQLAAWQDKLQQQLQEATMSREARKAALTQEEASLASEAASLEDQLQVLQRQIAEVKEQMERVAGRRKHVAEALSGRLPDQSKTAEQMQDDVKAAGTLKAVLDGMASTSSSATAPDQATQPISAYADAVVTLLTCTKTSASELLERGRQAARHVKNARHAAQQVESMAAKEQRERLKPSALAALEGREQELKGVHKAADSLAAGFEKAAAGFSSRKGDPSMPSEKATQVADLLKAVRAVLSEVAAGPEPAPEPQKSEQAGGKREKRSAAPGERHAAGAQGKLSAARPEAKSGTPDPPKREPRPPQNQKLTAAEARKRAGFVVKEKEQPAWMRKPGSSVPARPAPQHAANGHAGQASKPVTPQKPVSYAKLLNGHAARLSMSHADTDTATEEESILDAVTTSEKSTPPKGKDKDGEQAQDTVDTAQSTEACSEV